MQKYFLDHKSQFEQYLDEKHKSMGDFLLDDFKDEGEMLLEEIAELAEDEKEIEDLKKQQFAYQNNIDFDISHMNTAICQYIPETMSTYMAEHSEIAIPEIVESYRMACEIFGISRDGVFSKVTEGMIEQQKQTPLQQREAELSELEKEEKTITEAETLIDMQNSKEGQDIGE